MNRYEIMRELAADILIEASTTLREDQISAYEKAIEQEDNSNARWVLERILENGEVAEKSRKPLCDDTGIPHVFLDVGTEAVLDEEIFNALEEGIGLGLERLPGRPMAVKGDDLERLGQEIGLYQESSMVLPAPIQVRRRKGKKTAITVLMLGGGPEIRAKTYRVFHRHKGMTVIEEAARWAASEAANLGCTPAVPAIGIGRTHYEATCLMLEAMKQGTVTDQSSLERKVTDIVNQTKVGPLGLGGKTTALASFIKIGPLRAGGTRMVSVRVGCCWDPRRASRVVDI
jgi:fumarate hydratase subunit alpha